MSHQRTANRKGGSGAELVSAIEIGYFVDCKEAWRLRHEHGLPPGNRDALDAGDRHYAGRAVAERIAGGSIMLELVLAVLAAVVLLLLL